MTAHVSIFDLKRFTEQRLGTDELPSFEEHLSACAACAARLQQAATRELARQGLLPLPAPANVNVHRPFAAAAIALAASVMFVLSQGQATLHFPSQSSRADVSVVENGTPMQPLAVPVLGAGLAVDGGLAFKDGGRR